MNRARIKLLWLALLLGVACGAASAQETTPASPPAGLPPSPPPIKSPVDRARELLAMTPAERKQAIADRTPENQKLILTKIREYESLRPDQRELRLRATELHWYLLPLMSLSATNRAAQLALIPEETRKLVEARLVRWDALKPNVQKELLENEQAMQLFMQLQSSNPAEQQRIVEGISPARLKKLEAELARLQAMPEDQRRNLSERFNEFFDLTPQEKEKVLRTFSDTERRQMEKTLRAFENLPDAQRRQCIQSFKQFAGMSVTERQQFLKNAERWRVMSPDKRAAWRDLVNKLELPPPPPGMSGAAASPPSPPGLPASLATNGGRML